MFNKFSLTILLAVAGSCVMAQQTYTIANKPVCFGIQAGIAFFETRQPGYTGIFKEKLLAGFTGGVDVSIHLNDNFYLQPALTYTQKGSKSVADGYPESKVCINYIQLPVHLMYEPKLGKGRLLAGAGIYTAMGLNGKGYNGSPDPLKIEFVNSYDPSDSRYAVHMRRMDAGLTMLAGYEWKQKFSLQLMGQLGLMNINPSFTNGADNPAKIKNEGFTISAGYRF